MATTKKEAAAESEPAVTTDDVAPLLGDPTAEAEQPAPIPAAPKFGMCEGTREELERTGKATDPFTGEVLTRDAPE